MDPSSTTISSLPGTPLKYSSTVPSERGRRCASLYAGMTTETDGVTTCVVETPRCLVDIAVASMVSPFHRGSYLPWDGRHSSTTASAGGKEYASTLRVTKILS